MTKNAETPRVLDGAFQEVIDIGGDVQTDAIVTPIARPVIVATAGRVEFAVRCPECGSWHRHVTLGEKTAPCGTTYVVQPKRGRAAA